MGETAEVTIIEVLSEAKACLVTAESCSGGRIADRLTDVPGASDVFLGGIIAYSNAVKMALLGVPEETLATKGAVSEETACAMAEGARVRFGADYAIAVTGIAGPSGGTPEKAVGLVFIVTSGNGETWVTRNQFEGSRGAVKSQTAERALQQLVEHLT